MTLFTGSLSEVDPEIAEAILAERGRQNDHIELIASENFTSRAVLEAAGSVLTNKYAEGYPGKRYYGGCEHVDSVERLAIARAQQLFGADHVNVQPHSGTQANVAVYLATLKPGDKILTMRLDHGGHLTHGYAKNISGMLYQVVHYGVDLTTGFIDYDALEKMAMQERPKMITVGASAYSRTINFEQMGRIARQCGALLMADIAHIAGLVAAGLHPSPVSHADFVTSTTHKTLRGPRGGIIMCKREHAAAIDSALFPGNQGGPLMHIIAAKAVCFKEALGPDFKFYQKQVLENAHALCSGMARRGFHIVSGGTDNHLFLVDLRKSHPEMSGKDAQDKLGQHNITLNRNTIPGETRSPFQTSGLRLGSPAVTTRGMGTQDMDAIAEAIALILNQGDAHKADGIVRELCGKHPLLY